MHEDGEGEKTSSTAKIFANIFIAFIGAGVLGLPFAFKEAGVVEGTVIMLAIAALSTKAMLLIVDCKDELAQQKEDGLLAGDEDRDNQATDAECEEGTGARRGPRDIDYGDVGFAAIGHHGRLLVDASIVISQTGFCCAYLIFISENLAQMFPQVKKTTSLLGALVPLILLTSLRTLKSLGTFSLFADLANILAYSVVFWFDLKNIHTVSLKPKLSSLSNFPFFLGVAIYCYEGAGMILSLESSAAQEVRWKFRRIFITAMVLTTMLYILFGVCGYLSFGSATNSIITLNLQPGFFPVLVKSCLSFSLFFTYPVMIFPVVRILENASLSDPSTQKGLGNALRFGVVVTTILVVMVIPDFSTLIALIGSTCCTLLAFILPAIFHYKIFQLKIGWCGVFIDGFLIILGIVGGLLGLQDALHRLTSHEHKTPV